MVWKVGGSPLLLPNGKGVNHLSLKACPAQKGLQHAQANVEKDRSTNYFQQAKKGHNTAWCAPREEEEKSHKNWAKDF